MKQSMLIVVALAACGSPDSRNLAGGPATGTGGSVGAGGGAPGGGSTGAGGAAVPGPIGATCTTDDKCTSGHCLTSLNSGYCTTPCSNDGTPCAEPVGAPFVCADTGWGVACVAGCNSTVDCTTRFGAGSWRCIGKGCVAGCVGMLSGYNIAGATLLHAGCDALAGGDTLDVPVEMTSAGCYWISAEGRDVSITGDLLTANGSTTLVTGTGAPPVVTIGAGPGGCFQNTSGATTTNIFRVKGKVGSGVVRTLVYGK